MTTTLPQIEVNGKPIQVLATAQWGEEYGSIAKLFVNLALEVLQSHPVDMLSFESALTDSFQIRSVGYHLETGVLDEETVLHFANIKNIEFKKFWFKLDDYGDKYVGVMMFPEEY